MKIFNWVLIIIFLYIVDFKGFVQHGITTWEQGLANLNTPDRRKVEISDEQFNDIKGLTNENYCG